MLRRAGDEAAPLLPRRPRPPAATAATAATAAAAVAAAAAGATPAAVAAAAAAAAAGAPPAAARRHAMVYSATDDDDVRTVEVYAPSGWRRALYTLACALALGIPALLLRPHERARVRLTHRRVWGLGGGGDVGGGGGSASSPPSARGGPRRPRRRRAPGGAPTRTAPDGGTGAPAAGAAAAAVAAAAMVAAAAAAAAVTAAVAAAPPAARRGRPLDAADVVAHVRMLTERERDFLSARFASYQRILQRAAAGVAVCGVLFEVQFRRYLLVDVSAAADGDGADGGNGGDGVGGGGDGDGGGDPSDGVGDGAGGGGAPSSSASSGEYTSWLLADSSLLLYSVPALLCPRAEELFVGGDGAARDGTAGRPTATTAAAALLPPATSGLDASTAAHRGRVYGANALAAPVRPVWRLFVAELLNPVFLFQVASVGLWLAEKYVLYAAMILATSVVGAGLEAAELHAAAARLARLAAGDGDGATVEAYRDGVAVAVPVRALVPGDVIRLRGDAPAPADCTLLRGSALCNEASLTGESSPVHKHPWVPPQLAARLSPAAAAAAAAGPLLDGGRGDYGEGGGGGGRLRGARRGGPPGGGGGPSGRRGGLGGRGGGGGADDGGGGGGGGRGGHAWGSTANGVADPPASSSYHDVPQELLISSSPFAPSFVEDVHGREDHGGRGERDGEDWRARFFHQHAAAADAASAASAASDAVSDSGSDTVASSSDGAWSELDVLAPRSAGGHLTRGYGSTADLSRLASADAAAPEADDSWAHGAHTVYAGTRVLQARRGALAVVTRTAASTMRGELVRDILVEQATDEAGGAADGGGADAGGGAAASTTAARPESGNLLVEAYAVLAGLLALGVVGAAAALGRFMITFHLSVREATLEALDLITIAVPPSLPAAISFGLAFALARLTRHGIICVRASVVTRAALVDVLCFDKTGTLTEEGLDVRALRLVDADGARGAAAVAAAAGGGRLLAKKAAATQPLLSQPIDVADGCLHNASLPDDVERVMAACHTLAYVQGAVVGDEVDLKLFELSGWRLVDDPDEDEAGSSPLSAARPTGGTPAATTHAGSPVFMRVTRGAAEVVVTRLLDFSSPLARMGTVAEWARPDGSMATAVLVKGAPEVIASLCRRDTVPSDFAPVLAAYAAAGFRVLALASRDLSVVGRGGAADGGSSGGGGGGGGGWSTLTRGGSGGRGGRAKRRTAVDPLTAPREVLERDLCFLALVVLENRLKGDTTAVIEQLSAAAKLPCRMVTGDHARTAMAVALQCGILKPGSRIVLGDVAVPPAGGGAKATAAPDRGAAAVAAAAPRVRFTLALDPRVRLTRAQVWAGILRGGGDELVLTGGAFRLLAAEYAALTAAATRAAAASSAPRPGAVGRLGSLPDPPTASAVLSDDANEEAVTRLQRAFFGVALQQCSVWARMTAADKTALVRALAAVASPPLRVAMCGDGANDAGALREAFVGLSLRGTSADEPEAGERDAAAAAAAGASVSGVGIVDANGDVADGVDVEALRLLDGDGSDDTRSVASSRSARSSTFTATTGTTKDHAEDFEAAASLAAPLTSRRATIRAMVDAIQQGRAAAAASLAAFCYMFLYSTIQFVMVAALYSAGAVIGDMQFLFVDLVIVLPLATLMGRTDAARTLTAAKPPGTLRHPAVIASGLGQAGLQIGFQLAALAAVWRAGLWDGPEAVLALMGHGAHTLVVKTPGVSALWAFVNLQYVWTAVALNRGPPFRRPLSSNVPFAATAGVLTLLCLWLLVAPTAGVRHALELLPLPPHLRVGLGGLALLNGACSVALDVAIGRWAGERP
ncbi:hypothetical protein BU14_0134s0015 [Porphyra umbilicalis]|uniref:Cation-transporting P-type ATPase N-terminal domain-containing protein n=1 Tax=Porphyra umbilicalis TaxID=2786 RepID=A0A1X6PAW8_PORUM|nr:hypothetical protein BU14_0134s0015 [Porphyra umbilicalis]|eukprot:OSX77793.1 hypothetical protein BU14_0134s0015 [Porphyra umbilicalis]